MTTISNTPDIISAIRQALPPGQKTYALHEPCFRGKEWQYTKECLDTGWVSSVGKFVDRFENELAEYTGIQNAVAVVNGTAALHIALKLVDVRPNDEVLIPALTFVATANAVSYCCAIPHFVDSEEKTLGLDPLKLEAYLSDISEFNDGMCINRKTGRRISAVIPMHTFGHPVDLDPLVECCKRFKLKMVEDAAESLGSLYKGKHTGNWGTFAILSFNGNKTITTGGGGAILTNDERLARSAKHLTTTAKVSHRWQFFHDAIGYNYRLPNINAALGCAQLEQLPGFLNSKRKLAEAYRQVFEAIDGVSFFEEPPFARSNYWLNALIIEERYADQRDSLLENINAAGYMARPAWDLIPSLPMYINCPKMDLAVSESLQSRMVNIPSSAFLY